MQNKNICSIITSQGKVIIMDERKDDVLEMTNEEYREELQKIFDGIDDNRILRYFYIFVSEKLKRVL